jgi:hypothetical protein
MALEFSLRKSRLSDDRCIIGGLRIEILKGPLRSVRIAEIAKWAVEAHGGTINVKTSFPTGAIFCLKLPIVTAISD